MKDCPVGPKDRQGKDHHHPGGIEEGGEKTHAKELALMDWSTVEDLVIRREIEGGNRRDHGGKEEHGKHDHPGHLKDLQAEDNSEIVLAVKILDKPMTEKIESGKQGRTKDQDTQGAQEHPAPEEAIANTVIKRLEKEHVFSLIDLNKQHLAARPSFSLYPVSGICQGILCSFQPSNCVLVSFGRKQYNPPSPSPSGR